MPGTLPSELPAYVAKYEADIGRIGHDLASFDAEYSVCVRITPDRSWGF